MVRAETNPDYRDLLRELNSAQARYLVVGAYAVIFHAEPRFTRDIDLWVEPTPENAERVWTALAQFGAPLSDLTKSDLCNPEMVYQIGVAPNRIDVLMGVGGLDFSDAWKNRVESTYGGEPIRFIGLDDLIRAKEAAGRPQDQLDLTLLREARARRRR